MWILILTFITSQGPALATAEFESYVACEDAGKQWVNSDVLKEGPHNYGRNPAKYSYQCAYKGKKQ